MEFKTLDEFKNRVNDLFQMCYTGNGRGENKESTQKIYSDINGKMNDKTNVFWNDVEMYYNDINSVKDAIITLETSKNCLKFNRDVHMNKTDLTYAALKFSIFAKFFTDTDLEYTNLFMRRIYQIRKKSATRSAYNGKQDWNNVMIMLLKASLKENSNEN